MKDKMTHGEQRALAMQNKHLENNTKEASKILGFSLCVPAFRRGKNFTPVEEMQAILDIYPRFKLIDEYWNFVEVAFANGFECGRGGITWNNMGRGSLVLLYNPKNGDALSLDIPQMMVSKSKKLTIRFHDENCGVLISHRKNAQIFYSIERLSGFIKEKNNGR